MAKKKHPAPASKKSAPTKKPPAKTKPVPSPSKSVKPAPKKPSKPAPAPAAAKPAPSKAEKPVAGKPAPVGKAAPAAKPAAAGKPAAPAGKPAKAAPAEGKGNARELLRSRILGKAKTSKPIAFSLDEVREIAKTVTDKGEKSDEIKPTKSKTAAKIDLSIKHAKPHHVKAASLADILGFNPKKARPADPDADSIRKNSAVTTSF